MTAILGTGSGTAFGEFKKEQNFMHTSAAASIGKGDRSNPNQHMPTWTPSPNEYNIAKGGAQNEAPKFK